MTTEQVIKDNGQVIVVNTITQCECVLLRLPMIQVLINGV